MNRTVSFRAVLIAFLVSSAWGPAGAEVSVDVLDGASVRTIVLADIVDDPDPIGVWLAYRPVAAQQVLNASGEIRGDGRPDLAFLAIVEGGYPVGQWPAAVWAYRAGADFDVAYSEWDGSAWTATRFLTWSTDNEIDPRIFIKTDGTVHVVWWTDGVEPKIYLSTRAAGSNTWDGPAPVTDGPETGRRPSVAVLDGELRVAYERDSTEPGMAQDVMVATREATGAFVLQRVASTVRTERLDAMIHAAGAHLWLEWKHVLGEFGSAVYEDDVWVGNDPELWADPSWIGVEDARKRIRAGVISQGLPGSQPPAE